MTLKKTNYLLTGLSLAGFLLLTACGGGDDDGTTGGATDVCETAGEGINIDALMTTNCKYLSNYRLFEDPSNPTANPTDNGTPYDLTTALFTDYTSKYRFVFVPEGKKAQYSTNEVFEFPVGTVITKTFALPADTAFRGRENETLLETRLLIHRESGWTALPYVWNASATIAEFKSAGAFLPVSLVHNGEQQDFTYEVPDTNMCKQCHQFDVAGTSRFMPIGPKARLLNRPYDYPQGSENQLTYWQTAGFLEGLPADLTSIDTIPAYTDADAQLLPTKTDDELMDLAKGYLDINCAHCHRPEGGASNTGLNLEYWRSYNDHKPQHGYCKEPVAYRGSDGLNVDLVPGDAESSILHYRINTTQPRHRMPEIGRALVHEEGVALVASWIDSLPGSCTP
ncbi:SO2930 family diheme c-type cytochrome [Marinobacter sp. KMM 10035]|uniref:SO2930 family diheme c-type cytochrome n=1 Tax=Marinobacter sp. KMM 10035 TaxID=3134034 RepID=UPI00397B474D